MINRSLFVGVGAPFGRVIEAGDRRVWYDVHENCLVEVDAVLADVLRAATQAGSADPTVNHGEEAVRRAVEEIVQARRQEGLFSTGRPRIAAPDCPADRGAYDDSLAHLTLCLTDDCNLRCTYCALTAGRCAPGPGPKSMPAETAVRAFRHFADRSARTARPQVSFYGGEPLLNPDAIGAVLAEADRRGDRGRFRFSLVTNLTLLDDETAAFVSAERLNLQVSLDGPPEIHDRQRVDRAGAPSHAAVMAGLRRLIERDRSAVGRLRFIATVAPPYDYVAIARYFHRFPLFAELGIDDRPRVQLNTVNLEGIDFRREPDPERRFAQWEAGMAAARRVYLEAHARGARAELPSPLAGLFDAGLVRWHHRRRTRLGTTARPGGACRPGLKRLFVRPGGDYLPCERVDDGLVIGHVDSGLDLEAVADLESGLAETVGPDCADCWALRHCQTCFSALRPLPGGGFDAERARRSCDATRAQTRDLLTTYLALQGQPAGTLEFLKSSKMV